MKTQMRTENLTLSFRESFKAFNGAAERTGPDVSTGFTSSSSYQSKIKAILLLSSQVIVPKHYI